MFSPSPEDDEDKSRETESFKGTEESEESQRSELLYGVDDSPSYILSVVLAFQVSFFFVSPAKAVYCYGVTMSPQIFVSPSSLLVQCNSSHLLRFRVVVRSHCRFINF